MRLENSLNGLFSLSADRGNDETFSDLLSTFLFVEIVAVTQIRRNTLNILLIIVFSLRTVPNSMHEGTT